TWLEWGSSITDVTDMVNQAIAKLGPGQCIGRLIICTHGSKAGAFMVFDPETSGVEVINGREVAPTVQAQLRRLRTYFCPDGVIEFRCCLFGAGDKGKQAVQAIADLTGVAVTAPEDKIEAVMFFGGISVTWATALPSSRGLPVTSSFWRGEGVPPPPGDASVAGVLAATPAIPRYIPMPGLPPPAPPGPAVVPPSALPPQANWGGYPGIETLGNAMAKLDDPKPSGEGLDFETSPPVSIIQDIFPDAAPAPKPPRSPAGLPVGIIAAVVAAMLIVGVTVVVLGQRQLASNDASSSPAAVASHTSTSPKAAGTASAVIGGLSHGGYNPDFVTCILRGSVPGMVFHGTLSGPNIGSHDFTVTAGQPSNGRSPASPDEGIFVLQYPGQGPNGPFTCTLNSVDPPNGVTLGPHNASDWTITVS
ncbi:MAG TPA: hypothetical protein VF383_04920, partial [Candidatus Dormibacteraeota bacterium]